MDEIGIELQRNEPTFESVVSEKSALYHELQEEDLYSKYKKLSRHLEMLEIQESYIKDEQANLKRELIRAQEEVKRIQAVPLVIGQFLEPIDQNTGIVGSTTGSNYVVRILSTLDRELLKPSSSVALHRHSNALVDILPPEADSSIAMLGKEEKPDVTYQDVGGMDSQKQEIREAVELPLTHFDLYKKIGIDPPRGVLLYGPPGTGKTMLVKAVAHHTTASFIRVVGSEFVQKYLGEGPRMVRDVFRLARENSPAIIFIDEIDAIATKRFDAQTGADREVQRILLELLNQMDGFDQGSNVKVIMATNRADTLDPALLRPGRLDRKIEFPRPSRREKRLIFQTVTSKMNLGPDVDLEDYVSRPDPLSSADIASIVQAAGLQAVRKNRYVILPVDFEEAWKIDNLVVFLLLPVFPILVQSYSTLSQSSPIPIPSIFNARLHFNGFPPVERIVVHCSEQEQPVRLFLSAPTSRIEGQWDLDEQHHTFIKQYLLSSEMQLIFSPMAEQILSGFFDYYCLLSNTLVGV
ncbi:26S proteasome regulatory subunit 6B [Tricholoma furcatifolium]|nr:26S proteasome regulatory subunit 6B [Tricholoma furcatifolium]